MKLERRRRRRSLPARRVRKSRLMRVKPILVALALATVVGCHDRGEIPKPVGPTPSAAASGPDPASRPIAAKRIVRAWSEALDRHDIDALGPLYAPKVTFYGADLSRAAVLAAKKRALGRGSTFEQQIVGDLEAVDTEKGPITISFTKRSGSGGKLTDIRSVIVVDGATLAITEEHDAASEARAEQLRDARCFEVVAAVVSSLPAVKKILGRVEAGLSKFPNHRMGGIGPMRVDDGSVTGGLGVHSDERYEAMIWYTVSPEGKLEVTAPEALSVPAADAARVKAVCSHK